MRPTVLSSFRPPTRPALNAHWNETSRGERLEIPAFPSSTYLVPQGFPGAENLSAQTLNSAPAGWEGELERLKIGGIPKLQEHAMFHVPSRTLIVADLLFQHRSNRIELDKVLRPSGDAPGEVGWDESLLPPDDSRSAGVQSLNSRHPPKEFSSASLSGTVRLSELGRGNASANSWGMKVIVVEDRLPG